MGAEAPSSPVFAGVGEEDSQGGTLLEDCSHFVHLYNSSVTSSYVS
jgi:hypothetical protein